MPKTEQLVVRKMIQHLKLEIPIDDDDDLYTKWEIVRGQLLGGSNSPELKRQAKVFLNAFRDLGYITGQQQLRMYAELGLNA
jgi:hypothetical protein